MRRISPAFALAALLLPGVASASDHRMTISEILVSSGGDNAIQYVELFDVAALGEPFPSNYVLNVYDVDGASLGEVPLTIPNGPPNTTRWYVATTAADAEFGTDNDDELTVSLPAEGQVCFERTTGVVIACVRWGCVNTPITPTYTDGSGASPPDGMSLGRQNGNGTYTIGAPTPDAANEAGSVQTACPTDPDAGPSETDAGTGGDPDAGPDDPDGGGGGGDGDGDGDGSGGDGGDDDSGCGCGTSSSSTGATGLLLLAAFFVFGRLQRLRGKGTRI